VELSRFSAIIEAYGAQADSWPEHERAAALALARSSVPAARALTRAQSLDAALRVADFPDSVAEPEHLAMLKARILAAARPMANSWLGRWLGIDLTPAQLWPSVAGLALATVLGFGVGIGGLLQLDSIHDTEDVSVLSSIDFPNASE